MSESAPSPGKPRQAPGQLPLYEAALAWCDRALVQELRSARADYAAVFKLQPSGNPFPTRFEEGAAAQFFVASHAGVPCGDETGAALRRLRAARAVEDDFRRRFASGEVALAGLRVKPQLDPARTLVPTAWAGLLVFDWRKSALRAADTEFVDVVAERWQGGASVADDPPHAPSTPTAAPRRVPCGDERSTASAAPAKGRPPSTKGRPPFPWDAMVAIASERREARIMNNKAEADALLEIFRTRFPSRRPPAHRTVKDHVGQIYATAACEAAPLKARK